MAGGSISTVCCFGGKGEDAERWYHLLDAGFRLGIRRLGGGLGDCCRDGDSRGGFCGRGGRECGQIRMAVGTH